MPPDRFIPDRSLPPYSYVPGHFPHPVSDPEGHSYQTELGPADPIRPEQWHQSERYLYGIDLFHYGYYWEAHEEWEALWHAEGRKGTVADFLKGLIQLAAAGVKLRQKMPKGVVRKAKRAKELFETVQKERSSRFLGMSLSALIDLAQELSAPPEHLFQEGPTAVLPFSLPVEKE